MRSIIPFLFVLTCLFGNLAAAQDPILARVIKEHLNSYPPQATAQEKATYLSRDIGLIAQKAKKNGINLRHYGMQATQRGAPCLTSEPVWDGRSEGIPLTFFIYAWPAECVSRAISPRSTLYRSNVHKHSTSCAFAILQGSLVQENYSDVSGYACNVAKFEGTDQLREGDVEVDDLQTASPFIHRLLCRDQQGKTCISLHAYGHPSEDKILRSAAEFRHKYVYPYELKQNQLLKL